MTGDAELSWGATKQAQFQLLNGKCAEAIEMHGWHCIKPVTLYTDASLYGAGCAITQIRINDQGKEIKVSTLYDAFTLSKTQRNYRIYKKELYATVKFARKYEHMLKGLSYSVILTDHKPLTYFLKSSMLDGIYARWTSELRCLDVDIRWIPSSRNAVADALSRKIYPGAGCDTVPLEELGELISDEGNLPWV